MTEHKEGAPATVPARVQLGAVKIHGPNSDKPEGTRERLTTSPPTLMQINYEQALELWGQETADQLFAGVPEEDR